jgi:NADH:ubiquinone reductase (H+-translocating)
VVHRVVIAGGGFGGLYAAKTLRHAPVEVVLLDRRNFHLFQPLLYQVATGSLSPGEIAAPLRALLRDQKNAQVLLGKAVELDASGRRLILSDGELPYDSLMVATGARNDYFGHDAWSHDAPGLKSIEDATRIRSRILHAFEAAEREPDPESRRAWLTFVIVGAGPTGVELAGALAEIARDTLRGDFRSIHPDEARILLLDGDSRVLPPFPPDLSAAAERSLIHLGVRPRTGVRVTEVDRRGVTIQGPESDERIAARTVIWAAGVATADFTGVVARATGARQDRIGRILVSPDLTVPGHPEIFVIGDAARLEWKGKPLPGVAPVAMQQGRYAANAIVARLRGETPGPFQYHDKGNLAVIGRASGVADFGRLRFHGWPAWLLWLTVHVMYLAQFRNRLLVVIRWGFQYLTFDRGARLISSREVDDGPRSGNEHDG